MPRCYTSRMETPTRLPRTTEAPIAEDAANDATTARAPARQVRLAALRTGPWTDLAAVLGLVAGWRVATWLFALLVASSAALPGLFPPASAAEFFARALLQGEALWHVWIAQGGCAYFSRAMARRPTISNSPAARRIQP